MVICGCTLLNEFERYRKITRTDKDLYKAYCESDNNY